MDKNAKYSLVLVICVTTFVVALIGTTFSYFTSTVGGNYSYGYEVSTRSIDSLVITSGDDLKLNGEEYINSSRSLYLKNANVDKMCYSVSLDIKNNTFVYSSDRTPVLLLNVTKDDASGFHSLMLNYNITGKHDSINIPSDGAIGNYIHEIGNEMTDILYFKIINASYPNNNDKVFNGEININKVECKKIQF